MKKILFTLGITAFVFGALFVSVFAIRSFYKAQTQIYDMREIKVCITQTEEWGGRNPSLTLYTNDNGIEYEIPSVWYKKFDADAFNENFAGGKEYSLIVNNNETADDSQVIFVYGIADEHQEYLSSNNAVSADKSNSVAGLVVGLAVICCIIILAVAVFINRKSVVSFFKEFYCKN